MEKLRIIVSGFTGSFCISGITWHYLQYVAGLRSLGHDVYYIEDTCGVNNFHDPAYVWGDPEPVVKYLKSNLAFFDLNDRWAFRDEHTKQWFGLSENKVKEICATADIVISVSNSLYFREEYLKIPVRVLVDTDPMFTQIPPEIAQHSLSKFSHHFSFGTNILNNDSKIPSLDFKWKTTVQPVCMKYWINTSPDLNGQKKLFSTVMNISPKKQFSYNGEEWGQKDIELIKILDLPLRVRDAYFEMGVAGGSKNLTHERLTENGWNMASHLAELNKDIAGYSDYIRTSFAEFSVAKETYVKANTGWFSDRSACYLAAGRPVVVQETQWSKYIPEGRGAMAFRTVESAKFAVEDIIRNYKMHSNAAKELAYEYFDSDKVLSALINQVV